MPYRREIPDHLRTEAFRASDLDGAGLSRSALRRKDIAPVFHGVHSVGAITDLEQRCAALSLLLGPHHAFSHVTAAIIWSIPLPVHLARDPALHVIAIGARGRVRRPGVVGWEAEPGADVRTVHGLQVIAPADVWAQLAGMYLRRGVPAFDLGWLVSVGDFLLTGRRAHGGRTAPLCTRDELERALRRRTGKRGVKALVRALELVRVGADSPKESLLRVGLIEAGLPEPDIQVPVQTSAGLRHSDLGYPAARLLLEYQGDHHRTDRKVWLDDLTRVQLFEDAGFHTIVIGDDDVHPDCRALAQRIRRRLTSARTR